MNPLSANPVTVLQEARANRGPRRPDRDRAVHAARAARRALEHAKR